jgi:hypothetical protein
LANVAKPVLGNHDLHLLSVSAGIRKSKKGDTIDEILAAPDAEDLLHWVRHRPVAHFREQHAAGARRRVAAMGCDAHAGTRR